MTPHLDIIIVNYNTAAHLATCMASLTGRPPATSHHICVVDNASTDTSVEMVNSRWPDLDLVRLPQNVGFAAANNVGIRQTSSPLILLLNSDTIVPSGAIDQLVQRMEATGAVAAGPRLIDRNGFPEVSFGPMLSPLAEAVQQCRVRLAASRSRWARRCIARYVSRERTVDWVSGACLLVRREAAEAVGLLDERYFMYEEDIDFCAALRAAGGHVLYTPEAEIIHLRGASFAATGYEPFSIYDRSHVRFYEKHAPHWAGLLRLWLAMRGRRIP